MRRGRAGFLTSTPFAGLAFVTDLDLSQLTLSLAGDSALALPTLDATCSLFTFTASVVCALVMVRVAAAAAGISPAATGRAGSSGDVLLLVRDGELQQEALARDVLSRAQVFEALRQRGIHQLGQVARFYLEPNGSFALVKSPEPSPGLSVWPEGERSAIVEAEEDMTLSACAGCGHLLEADEKAPCASCGETARARVVR